MHGKNDHENDAHKTCVCVCVYFTQVTLACNHCVTVWTVEFGHILCVFLQDVHLHGPTLGEACVADVTLVRFLS